MNITLAEIRLWVDNDEGLYNWWKSSRQSKGRFILENKEELRACIDRVLNAKPQEKTWQDYARRG